MLLEIEKPFNRPVTESRDDLVNPAEGPGIAGNINFSGLVADIVPDSGRQLIC